MSSSSMSEMPGRSDTPGCGCAPQPALPSMCSLDQVALDRRLAEWRQLVATARVVERAADLLRAEFGVEALQHLSRLCAAEVACCPFLTFRLDVTAERVELTIRGPLPVAPLS